MEKTPIDLSTLAYEAMIERGFIPDFPLAVKVEAEGIKPPALPVGNIDAKDLRKLLWFSIDNDDSRDLDQLTYAEKLKDDRYKLYIAVADVDYLVRQNGPIDKRASNNTTSVYTPTKIFPMLPERLSTDLTSLNEGQDRLALIFESTFIANACSLEEPNVYLAYVHNHAKLAYDSVSNWLDGTGPIPPAIAKVSGLEEQVRMQDSITQQLDACRHEEGSLTLETIEPQEVINQGIPVDIKETVKNRARKLIENFMIAANIGSIRFASKNNIITMRRVVQTPKRWDKIVEIARNSGESLPDTPDSLALEKFLIKQKESNPLTFPDLSLTIIKLLGRGEYRLSIPGKKSEGHFGLALRDYSHSTAPNRRFPDLIMQRLILAEIARNPAPYSIEELNKLAEHCTQKEDDADKVERRMRKSAAALLLSPVIGKEFDAIVTGIGEKGTWVRLMKPIVEGKLIKGNANLDVGNIIRVKLVNTDVKAGFIDFIQISK